MAVHLPIGEVAGPPVSSGTSMLSSRPRKKYRPAKDFPYRLRSAVGVYLGEGMFLEGFNLLNAILVAGTSTPEGPPTYVPPTTYFELAATLIVHPLYTTRAKTEEDSCASDEALRFLRDTVQIVGPVNAKLSNALQFRSSRAGQARNRRKRRRDADDFYSMGSRTASSDDESMDDEQLRNAFVGEKSVFAQREGGFWYVVGWAFNCSVMHKKRWARWKVWLEMMCSVLEEDFVSRLLDAQEAVSHGRLEPQNVQQLLARETLIMRYLNDVMGRNGRRRVVSAILADGEEKAIREFGEVWINETKEKKVHKDDEIFERRKTINLDEDEWGDYGFNNNEDDEVDESEGLHREEVDQQDFGGADAMKLRQRLLELLANVAAALPAVFTTMDELFDVYTEAIRPLPLPIFSQIISNIFVSYPWIQAPLLTNILLPFLVSPPRRPRIFEVTQEDLLRYYLPFAANSTTSTENAKMSLVVEHLLLSMYAWDRLTSNIQLKDAIVKGILAREQKAIGDARRKHKGRSAEKLSAKVVLDMSAERLRGLIVGMLDDDNATGAGELGEGIDALSSSSQLSDLTVTMSEGEDE